ncbi:MAG: carboxypeptidase-like regulatory domain-containing protein, partial [Segetibacter sp.]
MIAAHLKGMIIFLTLLFCCNNTFSQAKAIPLRDALKQVTKVYGTQFVFDPELIDGKKSAIAVINNSKSVEDVLKEILYPNDLVFLYIKSNYYSIVSKSRISSFRSDQNSSADNSGNDAIGSSTTNNPASVKAPVVNISGRVADEKNNPLESVTITVVTSKGQQPGTITNANGEYTLPALNIAKALLFSYTGMESQTEQISGRSTINVQMSTAIKSLDQVVV